MQPGDFALAQALRGNPVSGAQGAFPREPHQPQGSGRHGLEQCRFGVRAHEATAADVPSRLAGMFVDTRVDPRGMEYHWLNFRRGDIKQGQALKAAEKPTAGATSGTPAAGAGGT